MISFLLRFLVLAATAFGAGFLAARHWDEGDIVSLELKIAKIERDDARARSDAVAAAAARVRLADEITLNRSLAERAAQEKIVDEKSRIKKAVDIHVQDRGGCVTYGLVRVLDAAVLGADPSALSLPAGKSDGTCAPVKVSDLARAVAGNYGIARQNAEQLNALEAWVAAEVRASGGAK